MHVLAVIASDVGGVAEQQLLPGDRAAVFWGVSLAGGACRVQVPPGDRDALIYATAVTGACEPWHQHPESQPDLIVIGPGAINRFGDEFAGELADRVSAELLFDVLHVHRERDHWRVVCDAGRGAQDILSVTGPVVLVVSEHARRPPYVSRFRLMQAAESISTQIDPAPPGIAWQPVTPRARRSSAAVARDAESRANAAFGIQSGSGGTGEKPIIVGESAVCAQVLLRYLVHHGFATRVREETSPGFAAQTALRKQETEKASNPPALPEQVVDAIRRGPRRPGEPVQRMARRPRNASAANACRQRIAPDPLARGPRRLGTKNASGRRGPFPLRVEGNSRQPSTASSAAVDDVTSR